MARVRCGKRAWFGCIWGALLVFWGLWSALHLFYYVCGALHLFWCVWGALHLLAKRKADQNKRDEKEPTPSGARFSASRIREDSVNRRECLEDDRFHSVRIFASCPVFGNTQNCVRILLPDAEVFC